MHDKAAMELGAFAVGGERSPHGNGAARRKTAGFHSRGF
jgi:hypothetical protein